MTAKGEELFSKELNKAAYSLAGIRTAQLTLPLEPATVNATQAHAAAQNLRHFAFSPYIKIFPYLLSSVDALGQNTLDLTYSTYGGIDASLSTKLFSPLTARIDNLDSPEGRTTTLALSYPLFMSYKPGITSVYSGVRTDFDNKLIPEIMIGVSFPDNDSDLLIQTNLTNGGYNIGLSHLMLGDGRSLLLKARIFMDFDQTELVRGYGSRDIDAQRELSGIYSIELTHELLTVNDGLWCPSIFLDRVYGSLFAYYSTAGSGRSAYGYELQLALKTCYFLSIFPRAGLAVTEEGWKFFWGIQAGI
jgi:hypothetical protein